MGWRRGRKVGWWAGGEWDWGGEREREMRMVIKNSEVAKTQNDDQMGTKLADIAILNLRWM